MTIVPRPNLKSITENNFLGTELEPKLVRSVLKPNPEFIFTIYPSCIPYRRPTSKHDILVT